MEIWSLRRQGFSVRAIARRTGLDRRTVKKYIEAGEFPRYKAVNRKSALESYHKLIDDWLAQEDYQATRLYNTPQKLDRGLQGKLRDGQALCQEGQGAERPCSIRAV
ncbi:hypothetical protein BMS3Abin07_01622 [bacterium BMS3Abin07]|nr:hypothetical protein BMS3Abin07_01622 [bacterium BMS3Abin07]GBE33258.1 hypothetical protein BMS3Bbin05_02197 [bacterium BMS3Bbin05]HDL19794.1 hypothetical protein [Nitrospirota bacterium]HDO22962.1 hypothetical protein [Nitrospirota bacterium]